MGPDQILQAITGKILGVDQEGVETFLGTGYLVSPSEVMTCEHVVRGDYAKFRFHLNNGSECDAERCRTDAGSDSALLRLSKMFSDAAIPGVSDKCEFGAKWFGFGFGEIANGAGVVLSGTVLATSTRSLQRHISIQLKYDAIASGADPSGFSGSPVYSNGAVIGHISEFIPGFQRASELEVLWATPGAAIRHMQNPGDIPKSRGLLRLVDEIRRDAPESVVLAIFDLTAQQLNMVAELREKVERGDGIDLRYHYIGPAAASKWIALSSDAAYGRISVIAELRDFIRDLVKQVQERLKSTKMSGGTVSLVSLGCGDGVIDRSLLDLMQDADLPVEAYLPVDLSTDLLQTAVKEIQTAPKLKETISILPIYADLLDLGKVGHVWPRSPNVEIYSLLGYTFGNFEDEQKLINQISLSLGEEDLLLLDARCYQVSMPDLTKDAGRQLHDEILNKYSNDPNDDFASSPLSWITTKQPKSEDFYHLVQVERSARIPGTIRAYTQLFLTNTWKSELKVKASRNGHLTLAWSSVYLESQLEQWLKHAQFEILQKKQIPEAGLLFTNVYILKLT